MLYLAIALQYRFDQRFKWPGATELPAALNPEQNWVAVCAVGRRGGESHSSLEEAA